jgi:type III secretion system low calcium response chaperone LcrH/SycD
MTTPNTKNDLSDDEMMEVIDIVNESIAPELQDKMKSFAKSVFIDGVSPKEAMGINSDMLEGMYAQAYRLFNNGKYSDAGTLFRLLIMIEPKEHKYIMGLAATTHMMKDYENAGQLYILAGCSDLKNPMPYYHASDCYLSIDNKVLAHSVLEIASDICGDKKEYAVIKDRCKLSIDRLYEDLLKEGLIEPRKEKKKKKKKKKTKK